MGVFGSGSGCLTALLSFWPNHAQFLGPLHNDIFSFWELWHRSVLLGSFQLKSNPGTGLQLA